MFVTFFHELKAAGVPVTLREYLTLMEGMEKDLAGRRIEDFYYLSRAALIKDERNLDKFDRVFGKVFKGLELTEQALAAEIPSEWLKKLAEKYLTEEEKRQIEAMGGLDKLLETLRKRLAEQRGLLKNWFVIVVLAQMAIVLSGMAFMLFVVTIINHVWR